MTGDQDPGGDYGYDLVHEVLTVLLAPRIPAPRAEGGIPGRPLDLGGDLGYDEAHEL